MQFLLNAYDGKDDGALDRRLAVREQHLALGNEMIAAGQILYAAAILDDADKMIGSMMVLEFANRDELDAWLKREPYVVGGVWQEIRVEPCRPGPRFVGLHP